MQCTARESCRTLHFPPATRLSPPAKSLAGKGLDSSCQLAPDLPYPGPDGCANVASLVNGRLAMRLNLLSDRKGFALEATLFVLLLLADMVGKPWA